MREKLRNCHSAERAIGKAAKEKNLRARDVGLRALPLVSWPCLFKTESHCLSQAGPEVMILPQLPLSWDYRCAQPCSTWLLFLTEGQSPAALGMKLELT